MLRVIANSLLRSAKCISLKPYASVTDQILSVQQPSVRMFAHEKVESPEEFDQRFVDYFNREDLDGWMVRKGMTDLHEHDVIPEPRIVASALRACRRVNDYALAVRFLEAVRIKCGAKKYVRTIYPYIIQEVRSVLDELGISTPEEMGYDKPELFHPDPDWWPKRYYYEYGFDKDPRYKID